MHILIQELLSCRAPSPSHPVFLYERMVLFKIRALKEGRPYQLFSTPKFLETFIKSDFSDQNLLLWIIFAWKSMPYGRPLQSSSLFGRYLAKSIYFICYQSYALVERHLDHTEEWGDFHPLGSKWAPISYIIKKQAYETIKISSEF